MTFIDFISLIIGWLAQDIPFLILYVIIGFGPGFIIGVMLGNTFGARNKPVYREVHRQNIHTAAEHNAQWNPSHERWQK